MRLPKNGLIAAAVMLAGCAVADLIPRQDYVSDVSKPTVSKALTFRQATSQNLGWTYKQGATAKDITSATLVTFTYVPYDRAWSQVVTGAIDVATNGSVLVTFTPAQLNTNSGARPFDWMLEVSDGTYVLGYSYGKLTLLEDPSSGVTNTFPTVTTTVDWADVAAYTGTAASGPVRPGTGITTVTNADGSITISAATGGTGDLTKAVADVTYAPISVVDTTYTNFLAGDTEIVVGGDSRGGSNNLSIASTITRDTELAAYLQLAGGMATNLVIMDSFTMSSSADPGSDHAVSILVSTANTIRFGKNNGLGLGGVAIGYEAAASATAADTAQTAVGQRAAYAAVDSDNAVFYGKNAGYGAATCEDGTFIGESSGAGNTNSAQVVCVGRSAGNGAYNSPYGVFLGPDAGLQAYNSHGIVCIGLDAGAAANNSSNSVFIGWEAGMSINRPFTLAIDTLSGSSSGINALLYGEFDNRIIRVNGDLDVTNNLTVGQAMLMTPGTTFPPHAAGRLYYHSTSNKLFCSDGTAWNALW